MSSRPALADLLRAAFAAYDAGQLEAADHLAQQVQKAAPRHPGGHYLRGLVALAGGDGRGALGHLRQAERMGDGSLPLLLALADALVALGRIKDALAQLDRAARLAPLDGAVPYRRGQILAAAGHLAEAAGAFAAAVDLRPDHAESFNNLGSCLRDLGELPAAAAAFRRAIELRPRYARALANLGVVLGDLGQADEAIARLEEAQRLSPQAASVTANLAQACKQAGAWDKALPLFARLAEAAGADQPQPWLDYGLALQAAARPSDADDAFAEAMRRAPADARAPFCRAELARAEGKGAEAAALYRTALALDPADRCGAALGLALVADHADPAAAPAAYVADLFDGYARRFESELTGKLRYSGPGLLADLVAACASERHFTAMLDIGCGTGLAAAAFAGRAESIDGVDLSPRMIELARAKGLYRHLAVAEGVTALNNAGPAAFDLIVAADVLVYLGDLGPLFAAAARATPPDGLFAATLERGALDGPDWKLLDTHRYTHRADYIQRLAAATGWQIERLEAVSTRLDKGEPVPGLAFVARRA